MYGNSSAKSNPHIPSHTSDQLGLYGDNPFLPKSTFDPIYGHSRSMSCTLTSLSAAVVQENVSLIKASASLMPKILSWLDAETQPHVWCILPRNGGHG